MYLKYIDKYGVRIGLLYSSFYKNEENVGKTENYDLKFILKELINIKFRNNSSKIFQFMHFF